MPMEIAIGSIIFRCECFTYWQKWNISKGKS